MLGFAQTNHFQTIAVPVSIQCRNIGLNSCIYQLEKLVRIGFLAGIIGKDATGKIASTIVQQLNPNACSDGFHIHPLNDGCPGSLFWPY